MSSLWVKVQTTIVDNPKIIGLSDKGFRTFIEMMIYSQQHLSDGFIDGRVARSKWGEEVLNELMSNDKNNPSLVAVEDGYLLYNYTKYQTSASKVEEIRERAKKAGKQSAAKRGAQRNVEQAVEQTVEQRVQPDTEVDTEVDTDKELKRGTRLPKPFVLTSEMINWAVEKHPLVDFNLQTESFIDYWTAQPGQKGVKSDWVATWRNWIRNSRPTLKPVVADANDWMIAKPIELS